MSKCKTKAIQEDLGIFRRNHAYSWIIQTYSGIFRTLCNPSMLTVVYAEPSHIQHQKHIQNPGLFRAPVYSEHWHIQNPRLIQNPVQHLRLAFCDKYHELFLIQVLFLLQRYSFYVKNYHALGGRGQWIF